MKTFYFMSGLPRSGSTVLASILNQNPDVYVTPSSPMLSLLVNNLEKWYELPEVLANKVPEQLVNVTKGMIHSMWEHREESIIIDKSRGWGKNISASTMLFEKEIKIIATQRDLPSIMASMLTLIKNNNGNDIFTKGVVEKGFKANDDNLMAEVWFTMMEDNMGTWKQLKQDVSKNQLYYTTYNNIVNNPQDLLLNIEHFLDLPKYDYNFNNIVNNAHDDDMLVWGLDGLHTIRPQLKSIAKPALEVLGDELYNRFVEMDKYYNN